MDNYSLRALNNTGLYILFGNKVNKTANGYDGSSLLEGKININQDENINILDYQIYILEKGGLTPIESIQVFKGGKWSEIKPLKKADGYEWFDKIVQMIEDKRNVYVVDINFNDRIEKIKFVFNNNFVDPMEFELVYKESSKEAYYQKVEAKNRQSLIDSAQIKIATGNDLVNVYFQPCNDQCTKTVIELFSTSNGRMLLGKFTVDEGMFFKSITGLAYGHYEIKVTQYGKDNNALFTSDAIPFELKAPHFGGNGRHTVII